jgi:hypothetical protein
MSDSRPDITPSRWHTYMLPGETPEAYVAQYVCQDEHVPDGWNPLADLYCRYVQIRDSLSGRAAIEPDFFRMFHRQPDTYFGILSKQATTVVGDDDQPKTTYSIKGVGFVNTDDTEDAVFGLLENHSELISEDAYFTVNSYFKPLPWRYPETGLRAIKRKESNLAYLNACYVDIDVGRFNTGKLPKEYDWRQTFPWQHALFYVMLLEHDGVIPQVSAFAKSGRGLYLFWMLSPETKAFPELVGRYKAINKEICQRILPDMYADQAARDAARFLRFQGSLHRGAGEYVTYHFTSQPVDGYALDDLCEFLQLQPEETQKKATKFIDKAIEKGSAPARSAGSVLTNQRRFDDALKIFHHLGGFRQGKRYTSLKYVVRFMRLAGCDQDEITDCVTELGAACKPPYPSMGEENDIPVHCIVEQEFSGKSGLPVNIRNDFLADFFEVDDAVAQELGLSSIKPAQTTRQPRPSSAHEKRVQARLDALVRLFSGDPPTLDQAVSLLRSEYGIAVDKRTVQRDLSRLRRDGHVPGVGRLGRPRNR